MVSVLRCAICGGEVPKESTGPAISLKCPTCCADFGGTPATTKPPPLPPSSPSLVAESFAVRTLAQRDLPNCSQFNEKLKDFYRKLNVPNAAECDACRILLPGDGGGLGGAIQLLAAIQNSPQAIAGYLQMVGGLIGSEHVPRPEGDNAVAFGMTLFSRLSVKTCGQCHKKLCPRCLRGRTPASGCILCEVETGTETDEQLITKLNSRFASLWPRLQFVAVEPCHGCGLNLPRTQEHAGQEAGLRTLKALMSAVQESPQEIAEAHAAVASYFLDDKPLNLLQNPILAAADMTGFFAMPPCRRCGRPICKRCATKGPEAGCCPACAGLNTAVRSTPALPNSPVSLVPSVPVGSLPSRSPAVPSGTNAPPLLTKGSRKVTKFVMGVMSVVVIYVGALAPALRFSQEPLRNRLLQFYAPIIWLGQFPEVRTGLEWWCAQWGVPIEVARATLAGDEVASVGSAAASGNSQIPDSTTRDSVAKPPAAPPTTTSTEPAQDNDVDAKIDSFRTWTDRSGRTVDATLVEFKEGAITIRTRAGIERTLPLERFSPADQQFVREKSLRNAKTTPRVWTRQDGRQVEGTIAELSADSIRIRRTSDSREFLVQRDILSEADQRYVNDLAP